MKTELDAITEKLTQIQSKLEKIDLLLSGNGSPEKGIIVRLDRLEQHHEKRQWGTKTAIAAALTALAATLIKWFK